MKWRGILEIQVIFALHFYSKWYNKWRLMSHFVIKTGIYLGSISFVLPFRKHTEKPDVIPNFALTPWSPSPGLMFLNLVWHFRYGWKEVVVGIIDPRNPESFLRMCCVVAKHGLSPPNLALPGKPWQGGFRALTSSLHIIVLLKDHSKSWFSLSSFLQQRQISWN